MASVAALLVNGANASVRNAAFNTSLDVAGDYDSRISKKDRHAIRQEILV